MTLARNKNCPFIYFLQRITWNPTEVDRSLCQLKGKSRDECQNYIRVLAKTELRKRLLVCGTNAYNPLCRQYEHNETDSSYVEQFSGKGFCPYDPRHNSTALYTGTHITRRDRVPVRNWTHEELMSTLTIILNFTK